MTVSLQNFFDSLKNKLHEKLSYMVVANGVKKNAKNATEQPFMGILAESSLFLSRVNSTSSMGQAIKLQYISMETWSLNQMGAIKYTPARR